MNKKGFTLFELLIIIGIISLLLVVLVPAIGDAKEAAIDAVCKTRLRNLALECTQYAMGHGYYPWGSIDPNEHDDNYYCLDKGPMASLYPREQVGANGISSWTEYESYCWDFRRKKGQIGWDAGVMFGSKGITTVQGCPKCKGSDNWDGNPMTGYNYNVAYVGYVEGDAGTRRYPARYGTFKSPERVVVFGDGGYAGGANKFMRTPKQADGDKSPASLRKAGTQAFRHGTGRKRHCNMVFLDGHVEEFYTPYKTNGKDGWVDEETHSAFISSGNGIYGPRGWGEEDDFTENK